MRQTNPNYSCVLCGEIRRSCKLSISLCWHVFCDLLVTVIVLEDRSKAVFAFVCTSIVYVYWVCMCKWRGWGVRQRNTARAIVDTVLESAFVIHYDIFEKMLCMVHNAFLKNIWIFCFVHCCFATICCIIILENNCHVWRICWMHELFIFLKSWYCQLSNVPMICLCRLFRIAFIK